MKLLLRLMMVLGLGLLLGGCASYEASADPGRSLTKTQRFFVASNLNDNHGLDRQLVEALRAHGRTAELGPLTMMPDDTQVVLTYADRWAWDFGDHLVYLQLAVRDAHAEQTFATVAFGAKVPLREPANTTLGRLVDNLLKK